MKLLDFHGMIVSVTKKTFRKLPSKSLKHRDDKNNPGDNSKFPSNLQKFICRSENQILEKDTDNFF